MPLPRTARIASAVALMLVIGACDRGARPADRTPPADAPAASATEASSPDVAPASLATVAATPGTPAPAALDGWLGRWAGPEGTSLLLESKKDGGYRITITSLDGPRSFDGRAAGEGLAFERDGQAETLHAGNGHDTGMKWLADESDCLVVRSGEGYCRD